MKNFLIEIVEGVRARHRDRIRSMILETLVGLASKDGTIQADPLTATDEIMARLYKETT